MELESVVAEGDCVVALTNTLGDGAGSDCRLVTLTNSPR